MMNLDLDRENVEDDGENLENLSPEWILERLTETNAQCLEGLMVHLPQDESNGTPGLLDLLADALGRLPRLNQLAVGVGLQYLPSHPIPDHVMRDTAERMARAAPSLRYVGVHTGAWAVWRMSDTEIRLEELDECERQDVVLFAHSIYMA
jgi:hypothetical protein